MCSRPPPPPPGAILRYKTLTVVFVRSWCVSRLRQRSDKARERKRTEKVRERGESE